MREIASSDVFFDLLTIRENKTYVMTALWIFYIYY